MGDTQMSNDNQVLVELTAEQSASFDDIGLTIGASDIDRDTAVDLFFNLVYVNAEVNYTLWTEGSKRIMNAYAIKKGIKCIMQDGTLNPTVKTMWARFTKDVADKHGIVKPTKPTSTAKAKSEQRANAEAKLETLKAKPVEELQIELKEKLDSPTVASLNEAKVIQKAIEAKAKDAEKAESAEVTELRKDIKEILAKIESADVLRKIRNYSLEIVFIG
jgi:hypothetical protein